MKHPLSLLQGRLGIYNRKPYEPIGNEGIEDTSTRLRQQGGHLQQERMIADKKRSLDRAVWNSYQAAEVRLLEDPEARPLRALINPNRLKVDYDDKIISIDFASGIKIGSVFEWIGTKSYWLVYLQDLTELAYFKGDVRKCSHEINLPNGKKTYAAIIGPSQASIDTSKSHGIVYDTPNYTLNIMVPKTDENLEYFKRYSEFYLTSLLDYKNVCWRVEAVDTISSPGIIEVVAVEYYANKDEDDIENGIVNGLIKETVDPNPEEEIIQGQTFIKPKKEYTYSSLDNSVQEWRIDSKLPISYEVQDNNITLKWESSYSGQFDLYYGDYKKVIVVESLF